MAVPDSKPDRRVYESANLPLEARRAAVQVVRALAVALVALVAAATAIAARFLARTVP